MMFAATLGLGLALLALYVFRTVRTYYSLKHFGGHWSVGWSRLWLLRTQGSGEMNKIFTEVNREYGECVPIGDKLRQSTNLRFALQVPPRSLIHSTSFSGKQHNVCASADWRRLNGTHRTGHAHYFRP